MKDLPKTYTGAALVDLQVNGYAGFSFNSDSDAWRSEDLRHVRRRLIARGVGTCIITLVTADADKMVARAARYAELTAGDAELSVFFPKLHIEGPFISGEDGPRGAHPLAHCISPTDAPNLIDRIQEASGGRVGIVTLAPELDGAIELTRKCAAAGICVAIGHSQANDAQIAAAVEAGARMSTHLGNGSHQMLSRLDNYMQTQLATDALAASFVADGHHMPFTTLKNFIRAKTPGRSILVTDAIAAAEMPAGPYTLGELQVILTPEGRVSSPDQSNLAGSALTLDMAVINTFLNCDVSFDQAWRMASTQAADLIGVKIPEDVTVSVSPEGFQRR